MSNVTRKTCAASFTKAADGAFRVVLSTSRVDRDSDTIPLDGWILPEVVPLCWAHDTKQFPLGRVVNLHVGHSTLDGTIQFPPTGTYDLADTAQRLVAAGFLTTVSVGFSALDEPRRNAHGGVDFIGRKELHELSLVNVPANPDARIDARTKSAMERWIRDCEDVVLTLRDDTSVATRTDADRVIRDVVRSSIKDALSAAARRELTTRGHRDPFALLTVEQEAWRFAIRSAMSDIAATLPSVVRDELRRRSGRVD